MKTSIAVYVQLLFVSLVFLNIAVGNEGRDASPIKLPADLFEFSGTVLGPDEEPRKGAEIVLLHHAAKSNVRATTDEKGEFRFRVRKSEFVDRNAVKLVEPGSPPATKRAPWMNSYIVATASNCGLDFAPAAAFETSGNFLPEPGSLEKQRALAKQIHPAETEGLFRVFDTRTLQLVVDDVPIQGRIVTPQGAGIAGVIVNVLQVSTNHGEDLSAFIDAAEKGEDWDTVRNYLLKRTPGEQVGASMRDVIPKVVTDKQGRFTIAGIGRERIALLLLEGPGIETLGVYALTRVGKTYRIPHVLEQLRAGDVRMYYGAEFEHTAHPSIRVVGTVRDKDTGRALAGITIRHSRVRSIANDFAHLRTTTDRDGRFILDGMRRDRNNVITAIPVNRSYRSARSAIEYEDDAEEVAVDFRLSSLGVIKGRITDASTGKPVVASATYYSLTSRPASPRTLNAIQTNEEGCYSVAAETGRGVIAIRALNVNSYPMATAAGLEGVEYRGPIALFANRRVSLPLYRYNAVKEVTLGRKVNEVVKNISLNPGKSLLGKVVGPSGHALAGAIVAGLSRRRSSLVVGQPLASDRFRVEGYVSDQPRTLIAIHEGQKLAGSLVVKGEQVEPLTLRLHQWGEIVGRVVDASGKPKSNVIISNGGILIDFTPTPFISEGRGSLRRRHYQTDEQGRFRIDALAPGLNYNLIATEMLDKENTTRLKRLTDLSVEVGEIKDLGDVVSDNAEGKN